MVSARRRFRQGNAWLLADSFPTRKSAENCNRGEIFVILTPDVKAIHEFVIRKVEERQKEEVRVHFIPDIRRELPGIAVLRVV